MSEEQYLTIVHMFDDEAWTKDQEEIRKYLHRALGDKVMEWLADHGPAIVGKVEEMAVISSTMKGMTEVRMRMTLIPIGPLLNGDFYFQDGPVNGQRLKTDGSPYWRIPVAGEPMRLADYWADGPSAIAAKGPLIAVYVRKDGYYRFEGYER